MHEATFVQVAGQGIQTKAQIVVQYGNRAAHADRRPLTDDNALAAIRELFHITFWMARTYASGTRPADTLAFLPMLLPRTSPIPPATKVKLLELEHSLSSRGRAACGADQRTGRAGRRTATAAHGSSRGAETQ